MVFCEVCVTNQEEENRSEKSAYTSETSALWEVVLELDYLFLGILVLPHISLRLPSQEQQGPSFFTV